ncbi:cilia- and flagella-associated protein 337-like isoform X2 [Convolutriloba macropyga]|uniref:cilia- and flagella-associated protein 337-like isoform X2 n=1 Tax=Convolutriloba macropyga TaxID=536237 RepID=UPI003F526B8C
MPGSVDSYDELEGIPELLHPQMLIRPLTAGPNRTPTHRNSLSLLYEMKRPASAVGKMKGTGEDDVIMANDSTFSHTRPTSATAYMSRPTSAWKNRERIKQKLDRRRRLTVGQFANLEKNALLAYEKHMSEDTIETLAKIEDKIDYESLQNLFTQLQLAHEQGTTAISLEEFRAILRECIANSHMDYSKEESDQIEALFMKIDSESRDKITIDTFCTYMQLEYAEKQDSVSRQRQVMFNLPPLQADHTHRQSLFKICNTSSGDRTLLTVSQDGHLVFWSTNLEKKREKNVTEAQNRQRSKPKWITDFVTMNEFNKFILTTGDREIQFYELSTYEPYCQITGLSTVPLKMDYHHDPIERKTLLLFGDGQGCVHILIFANAGETLRTWKKSKNEGIPSVEKEAVISDPNVHYLRWQVHKDWVTDLKYFADINQVISSSNHDETALVIGCTVGSTDVNRELGHGGSLSLKRNHLHQSKESPPALQRLSVDKLEFRVYKGVKAFDFDKDKNIVVTGGMDRTIRMFNPYIPARPNGMLKGHNAPVCLLSISSQDSRIYSVSTDKMIKVWDIQDQSCLITIRPKMHQIRGDLQSAYFSEAAKAIVIAADNKIALLQLKTRSAQQGEIPLSHREAVMCCGYNKAFNHVVSCSEASIVKVWDFKTGQQLFEFSRAHSHPEIGPVAITCMTFDETCRRLITGGRDGILKIWNYNNGNCLKKLVPREPKEVNSCIYVNINKTKKVIAVGWDRRINLFLDSTGDDYRAETAPEDPWPDDKTKGHKEDILCVTMSRPNLLATSGYDGMVIIWNMISGRTLAHMMSPPVEGYEEISLDGDTSVNKLLFIQKRNLAKDAASLVCSGPRGMVHFWNIYRGGRLYGRFNAVTKPGVNITCMEMTTDDRLLFISDSFGAIRVFDVFDFCLNGPEAPGSSAPLKVTWRAHVESVTCMNLVEQSKLVVTSSLDCTVRLWTMAGEYVGTFGQSDLWDISSPSSFAHPRVPYDVLVHPESVVDVEGRDPDIPLEERKGFMEVLMEEQEQQQQAGKKGGGKGKDETDNVSSEGKKENKMGAAAVVDYSHNFVVTDEDIVRDLGHTPDKAGKRLRHERHRQPLAAAAASALDKHSHTSPGSGNKPIGLTYFDIEEDPEKLNLPNWQNLSKDDPFNKLSNVTSSSITSEG